MSETETHAETELDVDFPSLWGVKFFNDDFTPVEFVILILMNVFGLSDQAASVITYKVHEEGDAIVGAYMKDIAVTKAATAEAMARQYGHPLRLQAVEV